VPPPKLGDRAEIGVLVGREISTRHLLFEGLGQAAGTRDPHAIAVHGDLHHHQGMIGGATPAILSVLVIERGECARSIHLLEDL
jgi:hypothetical protein